MMLRVMSAALCCVLAMAAAAYAKDWTTASKPGDGSVFTFRGLQIGDPLDKKFAGVPKMYQLKKTYCESRKYGETLCYDSVGDRAPDEKYYPEEPRIGDVVVSRIIYRFLDNKFYGFEITFRNDYPKLFIMLEAKYGKASVLKIETVKNAMGASFDDPIAIWRTPHGEMKLEQRSVNINTGAISLRDTNSTAMLAERIAAEAREKGKSAF